MCEQRETALKERKRALASERDKQQQDKYRALAEERERTFPKPNVLLGRGAGAKLGLAAGSLCC